MSAITVPGAQGRTSGNAYTLRALAGETTKGLLLLWRRRATLIMAVVTVGLIYLMIEYFIGAGRIDRGMLARTIPGLFAYALASGAALRGSGGIAEEINSGTLEQAHLSPVPPSLLALGRLGALAVEGLVPAVVLVVAFWAGFGIHYTVRPDVLVPAVLTIADALAYGMLMAALTLKMRGIGALGHVFNMIVMFFGGIFVPVTAYPHGVVIFARFVPTTLGVEVLNKVLAGSGLGAAWHDGTLLWLLVHVVVLSGLGWSVYIANIRRARQEGGLSA